MSNVKRLPDCYRKDLKSNNYGLLQLNESAVDELRQDIEAVRNMLDLNQAFGRTLNLYGAMLDQLRGPLTDEQYRHMLFAQIGRNNAKGDYASIVRALVMLFGTSLEEITEADFELVEDAKPCLVRLTRFPESLEEAGFSTRQMAQIIKSLLPICVTLLLQFYSFYEVLIRYDNAICFQTSFYARYNLPFLSLDGRWKLDNTCRLSGYDSNDVIDFYPMKVAIQAEMEQEIGVESALRIIDEVQEDVREEVWLQMNTAVAHECRIETRVQLAAGAVYRIETASYMTKMNKMDGAWKLDGNRKFDGGRYVL